MNVWCEYEDVSVVRCECEDVSVVRCECEDVKVTVCVSQWLPWINIGREWRVDKDIQQISFTSPLSPPHPIFVWL